MQSIDLSLLTPLDALLQEGSVTAAAQRVGLSTPAMSHALARIREQLGDPILVRAGRGMVLTPRALSLKDSVNKLVADARKVLAPKKPFVAQEITRTFVVHATDYVLTTLGLRVDRMLREEAPQASLRIVPNTTDDAIQLRDKESDLAVGIYGDLPAEMRARQLITDRFVCVVRKGHPATQGRFNLDTFLTYKHIQVSPRGKPGGYLDDVLKERGLSRKVARAVPYFVSALQLVSETDYLLTISERIARRFSQSLPIELLEVPLKLRPYALSLLWHPRFDADEGHRFLRDIFVRAAQLSAGPKHEKPITRLKHRADSLLLHKMKS